MRAEGDYLECDGCSIGPKLVSDHMGSASPENYG
jgi:hypothetical protein